MQNCKIRLREDSSILISKIADIRNLSVEETLEQLVEEFLIIEYRKPVHDIEIPFNKEKEEWKSVVGYEGYYEVSNMGRIRSIRYGIKNLRLLRSTVGYLQIAFRVKNQIKRSSVHRIVAEAFIPNPENKPFVNHKNSVKSDNRLENLEWVTMSENVKHSYIDGKRNKERTKEGKKIIEIFDKEGNSVGVFHKMKNAAKFIGVNPGNMSALCNGKWGIKSLTKHKYTAKIINE